MRIAPSTAAGVPWLEHFPKQDGPAQKTLVTTFPFTIGRNDTADLPIKSSRVSREHASILRAADTYRIRDLDSTNGTFLNGERIEEATLTDGDILLVADLEFTFFSGAVQAPRNTVTQVIGFRDSSSSQPKYLDLLRSLRRLQETLLHGGYSPGYRPVVELRNGRVMGVEAIARPDWGHAPSESDRLVLAAQTRLAGRLRELFCLAVAEESLQHPGRKLFLPVEGQEIDRGCLEGLLSRMSAVLKDLSTVVFEVPDSEVNDGPFFRDWYGRIRDCGAALCYRDFAAGRARLEEHRHTPPDFIKLSPAMVRGVWQDDNRRSACETLLKTCRELDCQAIAAGIDHAEQAELLRTLGCPLGQGSACQKLPAAKDKLPATSSHTMLCEPALT